MNNYYGNPNFPGQPIYTPQGPIPNQQPLQEQPGLPMEQSYIENILRLNKGKKVTAYFTYPDSSEWRDKAFTGIVEEAGRDHIILSDPTNGKWYLLLMIYLDYVTFDEKINYSPSFVPNV